MNIHFTKMQALGNDFIIVWQEQLPKKSALTALAQQLCARHTGVGADGLVVLSNCADADVAMQIFNADGSSSPQCGNALRCVAMLLQQLSGASHYTIKSAVRVHDAHIDAKRITINMGPPDLAPASVMLSAEAEPVINQPLALADRLFHITPVSMGNPHIVIEEPGLDTLDIDHWGPLLERHELFPARVNVEFVQYLSTSSVRSRVWERGVGETLACGSGACAILVAGVLTGCLSRKATIKLPGGSLDLEWCATTGNILMTGPAEQSFTGDLTLS